MFVGSRFEHTRAWALRHASVMPCAKHPSPVARGPGCHDVHTLLCVLHAHFAVLLATNLPIGTACRGCSAAAHYNTCLRVNHSCTRQHLSRTTARCMPAVKFACPIAWFAWGLHAANLCQCCVLQLAHNVAWLQAG